MLAHLSLRKNLSSYPLTKPECDELASTPPKQPWYKKPLIVQIIAPVLIVLAVGACVGLAGVGVSQLLGGPNVFSTMASNGPAPSSVSVTILNGTGIQQSLNYQPASVTVAKGAQSPGQTTIIKLRILSRQLVSHPERQTSTLDR